MTSSPPPDAAAGRLPSTRATDPLESAAWQGAGIAAAVAAIAALHWNNDGLWYQGDAPRHAANGLFIWDWLMSLPANPLSFALSYYARYPVIAPVAYPPLFYALEAVSFGLFGPSPYVAKALVLGFAALLGVYLMLWGRRWIAPMAGWAGVSVILLPGIVRYSNAVLLNVPGTAIGLAALYHLRGWIDTARPREASLFTLLTVLAILTYYPAALVLPVGAVWALGARRGALSPSIFVVPGLLLVAMLLLSSLTPVHLARHAPVPARLLNPRFWVYYYDQVSGLVSAPWLALASIGVLAALVGAKRRMELLFLWSGAATIVVCLVTLPSMSDRYALILTPLIVLSGFLAIAAGADRLGRWRRAGTAASIVVVLIWSGQAALRAAVPNVTGVRDVAAYLREHAPADAVLYSGRHDGVFGFYVRAGDPDFARRVVLSNKLLYRYEQNEKFHWIETPHVSSPEDVAPLLQRECGCRWVAVELGGEHLLTVTEHHLRRALQGPAFERVRSFPAEGRGMTRIDLYRFLLPSQNGRTIDLSFPSFSARVFKDVEPIRGRR